MNRKIFDDSKSIPEAISVQLFLPFAFIEKSRNRTTGYFLKWTSAHCRLLGLGCLSAAWFFSALPVNAQTSGTWTGGGADGNWTTTGNWQGGTVPGSASLPDAGVATFNNSTNAGRTIVLTAFRNIGGLYFNTGSVGAFTLGTTGGSALQFYPSNGGGAPTYSIQMTSSVTNAQIINAPIVFRRNSATNSGGNQTILNDATNSAATLTLGGSVSVLSADSGSANRTLILSGSNTGANTVSGVIQEGGGIYLAALQKTGAGTWTLTGTNTYSSTTTLSGGILSVSNLGNGGTASSIGDSSSAAANLVFDGGTLKYTGANTTSNRAFTIITGKTATIETANNLSFAGATGTATTGSLTKTGAGALTLTGANTYTGATLVSGGSLVLASTGSIANSATVTVASGANFDVSAVSGGYLLGAAQALNGNGTVTGNTSIAGNLRPGNSPGVLTFTNALTLNSTANTTMEIQNTGLGRGTDYDGVTVGNLLTYGGTLTLSMTTLVANHAYNLFDFGSQTANFSSVVFSGGAYAGTFVHAAGFWTATTAGQTFSFDLASGDLLVSAIPEPSSVALLLTAGLIGGWVRRRTLDRAGIGRAIK